MNKELITWFLINFFLKNIDKNSNFLIKKFLCIKFFTKLHWLFVDTINFSFKFFVDEYILFMHSVSQVLFNTASCKRFVLFNFTLYLYVPHQSKTINDKGFLKLNTCCYIVVFSANIKCINVWIQWWIQHWI